MNKEYAKKLLNKTIDDYNRISESWSIKRWRLPNDVRVLANYIKEGDDVLDLGCGNGYFYEEVISKKASYTGADVSANQLKVCKRLHPNANLVLTKPLEFPFKEKSFDKVFCLSTIHHVPSPEFQHKFLNEIQRILKKDGLLFLTAWNLSAEELIHDHTKIDDNGNIFYPFKNSEGVILADRFIHIFSLDELSNSVKKANFEVQEAKIIKRGYGKFSNNLIIAKRV